MRLCFHRSLIYKPRWLCWLRRGLQGIFLVVRIQSRPMSNIFLFIILHHLKIPLKCKFPSYNYETKVLRKDFKYLSNKRSPATILLGKYSRPYAVIKDPTFTYFWKKPLLSIIFSKMNKRRVFSNCVGPGIFSQKE